MPKVTRIHDETIIEATRWDRFVAWFSHVFKRCSSWCSYCYAEACEVPDRVGQYWLEKEEGDPDPCICRHKRERHVQLYETDPGPRGVCYLCPCRGYEPPLHDNVYESPITAGTYPYWNGKEIEQRSITWKHDRKHCRVCNGTVNTVRGL